MDNEENKRHVWMTVGCPNKEHTHSDFRMDVEDGHFYCNHCNFDFTDEFKEIFDALKQQLKQTKM